MSMTGSGFSTIQCPGCHRSLPPAAQNCHFCGASLTGVARPTAAPKAAKYRAGVEPWVMTLFFIVAAYWILEGLVILGAGLLVLVAPEGGGDPTIGSITHIVGALIMAFGAFLATVGVGLIMKWEWCRGVVNVFCWLRILGGLWRIRRILLMGLLFNRTGMVLDLTFAILGIIAAGLQIWLLSETD
jgi:hypothetical protein